MKKVVFSMFMVIILTLQSVAYAENGTEISPRENQESMSLFLTDREKVQLDYEKLYLDSFFMKINNYFGDSEGFHEFGEIYIDNENEFRFVIAVAKEDERVTSFIDEIKGVIPEHLLSVQKVMYSKNDLIAVQEDILEKMSEGYQGLSKSNVEISTSVKHQKVIVSVGQDATVFSSVSLTFPEYADLLEVQVGSINQPAKARDDAFTEMGGGLKISVSCSTAATATKDTREFLITAGHCLKNIGSTVSQGGTNIGSQHLSGYSTGGTDVGIILLTNTSKKIGNKYYYNDVANAEYDKKYTTTSTVLTGQLICKSGYKSGITCGSVNDTSASVTYTDDNVTLSNMIKVFKDGGGFILGGDSGGTVFNAYTTTQLLGIVSGRNTSVTPEGTWGYITKIGPALANGGAVTLYTSDTTKNVDPNN